MTANISNKVVLCDELYSIYKRALFSGISRLSKSEFKMYEKLVSNIELDILTNFAQIQRCVKEQKLPQVISDDLQPSLIISANSDVELAVLAQDTFFKLVITCNDTQRAPPFFNLTHSPIRRLYSITCLHNQSRDYLVAQLKVVMRNADKILICDKYFSENTRNNKFFDLLPSKKLTIEYVQNAPRDRYSNANFIDDNIRAASGWTKVQNRDPRFQQSHDRYLIVDDKLEIMLSSGYDYLWNQAKEITCVFRELE